MEFTDYILPAIFFGVIFAFIGGWITSSRGEPYGSGFWWGFLLGIVGIVYLLVYWPPKINRKEVEQLKKDKAYAQAIQQKGMHTLPGPQGRVVLSRQFDKRRGRKFIYQIYINGHPVGEVVPQQTAAFLVPPGDCVVYVKMKRTVSNAVGFQIHPGQTVELRACLTMVSLLLNRSLENSPQMSSGATSVYASSSPSRPPQLSSGPAPKVDQAISLARSGQKAQAAQLLKEVLKEDPDNEKAWLCLGFCVERHEQKKYCLREALRINPSNQKAQRALNALSASGEIPAGDLSPGLQSCVECGQSFSADAAFCPYCGQAVTPGESWVSTRQAEPTPAPPAMSTWGPAVAAPATALAPAVAVLQCPVCHNDNSPHANLCAFCGYSFHGQPAHPAGPYYGAVSQPAPEPQRFRLHLVDLGPVVIIASLFMPWATLYRNTFLGNSLKYFDYFGIVREFNGSGNVHIAAIIFLILGLGGWVLARARLKPLAVLAALGGLGAQIYTWVSINDYSGMTEGSDGWFFELATFHLREGVTVGLVGAAVVLIGTIFYKTSASQSSKKTMKVLGILLLILLVVGGFCFLSSILAIFPSVMGPEGLLEYLRDLIRLVL